MIYYLKYPNNPFVLCIDVRTSDLARIAPRAEVHCFCAHVVGRRLDAMAGVEDAGHTRMVRGQIARRYVDTSMLDVRVSHGIVHLTGVIRALRTHKDMDLKKEMDVISTILKGKSGIRDVVWEITQRF
jgi:hypothetical protein